MKRVVVVGAGAAGTVAAVFAALGGARTHLLERMPDGGRKILMSGGGRCNLLPSRLDESRYVTDSSSNTLHKIVRSWPLREQVAFFENDLGVALSEEEGDKLFPSSGRAADVRDALLAFAVGRGVNVRTGALVTGLSPAPGTWRIDLEGQGSISADAVVLATGGLSLPETGSDGLGLDLARGLGHEVNTTYPALAPVTSRPAPFAELAGISLGATVTARSEARSAEASGGFLFTHRGYSGPAVLDVSHVVSRSLAERRDRAVVTVRWRGLSDADWEEKLRPRGGRTAASAVREELPGRLADAVLERAGVDRGRSLSNLRREDRHHLVAALTAFELPWTGEGGYSTAEVTGGGVSLSEIDPLTLESRRRAGLFICGEMLDAFGPIGGYNLSWAWVTGRAAGLGAARPST